MGCNQGGRVRASTIREQIGVHRFLGPPQISPKARPRPNRGTSHLLENGSPSASPGKVGAWLPSLVGSSRYRWAADNVLLLPPAQNTRRGTEQLACLHISSCQHSHGMAAILMCTPSLSLPPSTLAPQASTPHAPSCHLKSRAGTRVRWVQHKICGGSYSIQPSR